MSPNGSAVSSLSDPQLVAMLRTIASTYPKWMDKADVIGTAKFRELVKRASLVRTQRPMHDRGASGDRWRRNARAVVEGMEALERRVSAGLRIEVEAGVAA